MADGAGQQQGMPSLDIPFLNPDGTVSITWYRFLNNLWKGCGLGTPNIAVGQNQDASLGPVSVALIMNTHLGFHYIQVLDQVTGQSYGYVGPVV